MASSSETIISWNATNWITIILMAAIGFFGLGLLQSWYSKRQANNA